MPIYQTCNNPTISVEATARGPGGKSAYAYAKDAGYTGTEEEFSQDLIASNLSVVQKDSHNDFPNLGNVGILYIDVAENVSYRWDQEQLRYIPVGADWRTIKIISGGGANG